MSSKVQYLPQEIVSELHVGFSEETQHALEDLENGDVLFRLERLLEEAYARGYSDSWARAYVLGRRTQTAAERRKQGVSDG